MRLTRESLYCLQALAHLGKAGNGVPLSSQAIAAGTGISERFLPKCLKPLVTTGLLASTPGPNGGYKLRKPLREIRLLDVLKATQSVDSDVHAGDDPFGGRLDAAVGEATKAACKALAGVKLSDLAGV